MKEKKERAQERAPADAGSVTLTAEQAERFKEWERQNDAKREATERQSRAISPKGKGGGKVTRESSRSEESNASEPRKTNGRDKYWRRKAKSSEMGMKNLSREEEERKWGSPVPATPAQPKARERVEPREESRRRDTLASSGS